MRPVLKKFFLYFVAAGVLFSVALCIFLVHEIPVIRAAPDDNIIGFSWSENFGWTNFNCDTMNNCGSTDYGVDLDMEFGDFSGYAWNPNVGWINFDPSGPYPGVPKHGAKYEYEDTGLVRRITGWAKVTALGDEGWMKLHPDPWLGSDEWDQRRKITIDSSYIDQNLNNFPIPIFLNTTAGQNDKDITSIFDELGSNKKKLAVTGPDAVSQLYVEVEKWGAASEEGVLWVSSEDLDIASSSDTHLYLYYDNDHNDNSYVSVNPNSTSSNQIWGKDYEMVHHLQESGTSIIDSTSNNNDGTVNGATPEDNASINGAYNFGGSEYAALNNSYTYFSDGVTISSWIKTTSDGVILGYDMNKIFRLGSESGKVLWGTNNSDGTDEMYSNTSIDDGDWHFITVIYEVGSGSKKIYVDGVLDVGYSWSGQVLGDGTNRYGFVGVSSKASTFDGSKLPFKWFEGSIDEVRLASTTLSEAWIKANYQAGKDNLLSWGVEETKDYGLKADILSGEFYGWSWNKSKKDNATGLGWMSFNCADPGAKGCVDTEYNVGGHLDTIPEATNLSAPNWSHADACQGIAKRAFLRWDFQDPDKGAAQDYYRVVIDDDPNRADDIPVVDTGKVESNSKQYNVSPSSLEYDESYYWWVKVWDNHNVGSDWKQYSTEPDTDNDDGSTYTFTTYKHEFPEPYIDWFPHDNPSQHQTIYFNATSSKIYKDQDGYRSPSNYLDPFTTSSYQNLLWSTDSDNAEFTSSTTTPTTTVEFEYGTSTIELEITDNDGYTCSTSSDYDIEVLPTWEEIKTPE